MATFSDDRRIASHGDLTNSARPEAVAPRRNYTTGPGHDRCELMNTLLPPHPSQAELCKAAGVPEGSAIALEPLSGSRGATHRIRFCSSGGRSFVLKRVGEVEAAVHQLIGESLEAATMAITGRWRVETDGPGQLFLLLEDATGSEDRTEVCQPRDTSARPEGAVICKDHFQEALRILVRVHAHFRGRGSELAALGVPPARPAWASGQVRDHCTTMALCADMLGIGQRRAENAALGPLLEEQAQFLASEAADGTSTLLHGDFHMGNIAVAGNRSVRIIDWGEARTGVPAWDLVACGAAEVDWYWQALLSCGFGFGSKRQFHRQVRAVVICRMWEFLETGMGGVLLQGKPELAAALPVCIERLLDAAGSPAYRGGRGMVFAAGGGA